MTNIFADGSFLVLSMDNTYKFASDRSRESPLFTEEFGVNNFFSDSFLFVQSAVNVREVHYDV